MRSAATLASEADTGGASRAAGLRGVRRRAAAVGWRAGRAPNNPSDGRRGRRVRRGAAWSRRCCRLGPRRGVSAASFRRAAAVPRSNASRGVHESRRLR
eukprot:364040-Chlamydomonas_euryale.AAC.8